MNRPKATSYMALLMAFCLTLSAVMAVGDSQARITGTTTILNTVVVAEPGTVTSNCLISSGNQIILLGGLESGDWVSAEFTLEAQEAISGQLVWNINHAIPVEVEVEFFLEEGEGSFSEDHILELGANSKATVMFTIWAPQEIVEQQTVDVQVIFEDLLGTLRVELIPDPVEETEPPETEEPTGPSEPTDPSAPNDSSEPTEPEEPANPDEPEETTPPPQDGGVVDPIDPIAPSEPEHSLMSTPNVEENPEEETRPVDEIPKEEILQPEVPEEEPSAPSAQISLLTLSEFEITSLLPLKIMVSGNADRISLGLEEEAPLPPFTRYSLDGGENWYLLYFGGYIELETELEPEEEAQWLILADFSTAELTEGEPILLEAASYLEEHHTGLGYAETVPRATLARPETIRILTIPSQEALAEIALMIAQKTEPVETEPAVTEPVETEPSVSEPLETDPSAPTNPSDPTADPEFLTETEPAEETKPSEPDQTDPEETEPTETTEPTESTEPTDNGEELEATEGSDPTEPTEPTESEPTEPVAEPTQPLGPEEIPESGLVEGYYFMVALPVGWIECDQIRFVAERLVVQEDGTGTYAEVPWNPQSLDAVIAPSTGNLIVYMGELPPSAGTYRLTLECIFEGICFQRMQMTFFINYSIRSDM